MGYVPPGAVPSTRIPGLIREQDFGGVKTRFVGHMHMQWHIC